MKGIRELSFLMLGPGLEKLLDGYQILLSARFEMISACFLSLWSRYFSHFYLPLLSFRSKLNDKSSNIIGVGNF